MYANSVPRADKKICAKTNLESDEFRRMAQELGLTIEELHFQNWLEACDWVVQNTKRYDLFLTPRMNQSFKWHTGRPEVVSHKDIPQDAAGIVEWWRRCDDLYRYEWFEGTRDWSATLAEQGQARLEELGWKYAAAYALVEGQNPIRFSIERVGMKSVYSNQSFTIYELPEKPE
jgi:hypothetical protein